MLLFIPGSIDSAPDSSRGRMTLISWNLKQFLGGGGCVEQWDVEGPGSRGPWGSCPHSAHHLLWVLGPLLSLSMRMAPLSFSSFMDSSVQFSSVQSLSCVQLFVTPWTTARQASLSITNSRSLLKLMSIESVISSNNLILCRPLLLPPSIFPSIRVFSSESALCIRRPEYFMDRESPKTLLSKGPLKEQSPKNSGYSEAPLG